eukprot:scaffold48514_cov17-Tisochrysis_lutea.AAC.1
MDPPLDFHSSSPLLPGAPGAGTAVVQCLVVLLGTLLALLLARLLFPSPPSAAGSIFLAMDEMSAAEGKRRLRRLVLPEEAVRLRGE